MHFDRLARHVAHYVAISADAGKFGGRNRVVRNAGQNDPDSQLDRLVSDNR
jgi:hypothetical protein